MNVLNDLMPGQPANRNLDAVHPAKHIGDVEITHPPQSDFQEEVDELSLSHQTVLEQEDAFDDPQLAFAVSDGGAVIDLHVTEKDRPQGAQIGSQTRENTVGTISTNPLQEQDSKQEGAPQPQRAASSQALVPPLMQASSAMDGVPMYSGDDPAQMEEFIAFAGQTRIAPTLGDTMSTLGGPMPLANDMGVALAGGRTAKALAGDLPQSSARAGDVSIPADILPPGRSTNAQPGTPTLHYGQMQTSAQVPNVLQFGVMEGAKNLHGVKDDQLKEGLPSPSTHPNGSMSRLPSLVPTKGVGATPPTDFFAARRVMAANTPFNDISSGDEVALLPGVTSPTSQAPIPRTANLSHQLVSVPMSAVPTQIMAELQRLSQGGEVELSLRLDPEELGQLNIRMTHRDGGLHVIIAADRAETLELMRKHGDQLMGQFSEQGQENVSLAFAERDDDSDESPFMEDEPNTLSPPPDKYGDRIRLGSTLDVRI